MTVVTVASGYDLGYVWRNQAQGGLQGEQGAGGYYINAAQAGEAPGRWFGKGAEALGFAAGQEVERESYDAVYQQADPRDGTQLGRRPNGHARDEADGGRARYYDHLLKLKEAEPHATGERLAELERMAAQATRTSPAYTDVTVSYPKSISILHASIRENARQARLAGDEAAAAYWDASEAEFQAILQEANRAGLEHLQRWAVTRTGYHGTRVDGQEPGKYEPTGMVVTSWLQGTSRDGDPQDHVHNQIARMSLTARDGKWRSLDTMALRAQIGAVRGIVTAHAESALTRAFGVDWEPRADKDGSAHNEVKGITRAQIEIYSSRAQQIDEELGKALDAWRAQHPGLEPSRRVVMAAHHEVWALTRDNKPEGPVDYAEYAGTWDAKWESEDGTRLAAVAGKVSNLRGPGVPREPAQPGPAPSADAQMRTMQTALARVQERHTTWIRADLMREIADSMPPEAHAMAPADAAALVQEMTDRALAGEAEQVLSLDAPEYPEVPDYLRRELDGCSVYSRPGVTRYATRVQMAREQDLLAASAEEGAPHLTREQSAEWLGATPEALEEAAHARAQEATAQLPSGVTLAQAAALHASLTSDRTGYATVGPAGTGKTHVAAAAARMWRDAGKGDVILVAPSQAACNVLRDATNNEFPVYNTAQFLGHVEGQRGKLGPVRIEPGTLILADESSMTSLADLRDIARHAEANESVFRPFGDDGQLTAPEGGGGLALLTRRQGHVQLAEPLRFAAEWEGEASLRLRAGDAAILDEYDQHGRIRGGGTLDEVMDEARKQYLAGYLQGRDVLLMAQSNETARELSGRVRDDLQHLGLVERGAEASLREGAKASVGDLIVTRKIDHRLGVANGDTWRVEAVNGETITMRKLLDADRETGARRFADTTVEYKAAREAADLAYADNPAREDEPETASRPADLGYTITGHTAQGRTVWQGIALITGTEDRNWAYVAMTRGRDGNYAWVAGQPAKVADPAPGVRPAPELDRRERIERERAGLPDVEREPTPLEEELAREAIAVLSDVLERDGAEYSALETRTRALADADHLAKLHAIWSGETREPTHARYERELRDALPEGFKTVQPGGTSTWLYRTLRAAEAAGLNSRQVLDRAINSRPLAGARDVAAVVDARIRQQVGSLVPQMPGPWSERVPDDEHQERRDYLTRVARAMDDRTRRLGEFTATAPPAWAERAFGPVPDDPDELQKWQGRASAVASYRELSGYDDPAVPIGPEPVNSPDIRAHWHAAFAALGPVDSHELMGMSDGQLLNRRNTYEAETAWAPRWVGDELRQVRIGADTAERNAVLSAARAEAARKQEQHEQAEAHETLAGSQRALAGHYRRMESDFAKTMETRQEWEETTRQARHDALAANSEYLRRHPDTDLPPMKSAEPPQASEEERAQIHVPELAEPPAWLADMAERTRAASEEIANRRSMEVPHEDHEWQGQQAWPASMSLNRDAILQPPPPQIPPAAEVAERSTEMDVEAGE